MARHPTALSGWLLEDGRFVESAEWWHTAKLYDLRDDGHPLLTTEIAVEVLASGDEDKIKLMAVSIGFIKLGRGLVEGHELSRAQLETLQQLFELCSPEDEVLLFLKGDDAPRRMAVARISKAKDPRALLRR